MFPEPNYKRVVVKFPPALLRRLDGLVKITGSNRSEAIRVAVEEMINGVTVEDTKDAS